MSAKRAARRRVAVVTGVSSGIGQATAELLGRRGVTAVGVSRRVADSARTLQGNVREEASIARVFAEVARRFGRVDILVNCAGMVTTTGALALDAAEWMDVLQTNLIGTYLCCKHALPLMRAQRFGRIVNVSSIAARGYSRNASLAYTSSKYGVIGLTRQLAAEFGREGITVNCVCPSETATDMLVRSVPKARLEAKARAHPMGRLATPTEVAEAIAFLASDEASYISGATVDVNGGMR
jgi:NAD(P)-dependent dehydrogenase (short-subunit alcohol dehydrogenase family)